MLLQGPAPPPFRPTCRGHPVPSPVQAVRVDPVWRGILLLYWLPHLPSSQLAGLSCFFSPCRQSEWIHIEGEFAGIMLVIMPCRSEKSVQGVAR
mgnify:CR=1 FL=1